MKNEIVLDVFKIALEKSLIFSLLFILSNISYHFVCYGIELTYISLKISLLDLLITYLITLISLVFPLVVYFASILLLNITLISTLMHYRGKLVLYQTLFLILGLVSLTVYKIVEAIHIAELHLSMTDIGFMYGSMWFATYFAINNFYKCWIQS